MYAIEVERVTKEFDLKPRSLKEFIPMRARGKAPEIAFRALDGVSFTVEPGSSMGLMGRNGSGKSTMLKVIAGVTPPTYGRVTTRGRVSPLLELGAGFSLDLSGRENIILNGMILGLAREEIEEAIPSILEFAELTQFVDLPVKRYSSGMMARLGFAVAAHSRPEVLLLDEILAVGDEVFREKCYNVIRGFQERGVTILMVSHQLDALLQFCQRAAVLDHGRLLHDGDTASSVEFYRDLLARSTPAATMQPI